MKRLYGCCVDYQSVTGGTSVESVSQAVAAAAPLRSSATCAAWSAVESTSERQQASTYGNFIAGGLAGLAADVSTYPLDSVKTRLQTQVLPPFKYNGVGDTFRKIFIEEGLVGLFRGVGVVATLTVPATALYFGAYEVSKDFLLNMVMASGSLASIAECLLLVPMDTVKVRRQVQGLRPLTSEDHLRSHPRFYYKSNWDAVRTIVAREGVSGLYAGYTATVMRDAPFSALQFLFYEELFKFATWLATRQNRPLRPYEKLLIGGVAGGVAGCITHPVDVIKTRLQTQGKTQGSGTRLYLGTWDALRRIVVEEGAAGLFKGVSVRVGKIAPQMAIQFAMYEMIREKFFAVE